MKLNIGENIRKYRRSADMTQEQLAETLGVSVQSVSRWETGVSYPDMELLPGIASVLQISVAGLFDRTEEEADRFCKDLQERLTKAANGEDPDEVISLLQKIRRNLREYYRYWFHGLFNALNKRRWFENKEVMAEIRLLSKEVFLRFPKDASAIIEPMAEMEDEEHLEEFLDAHAARDDQTRTKLLLSRYRGRGESEERYEEVRKFHLWFTLEELIGIPRNWALRPFADPDYTVWRNKLNLDYLNRFCGKTLDPLHPVTGDGEVDIFCETRLDIGFQYAAALAETGNTDGAFTVLEDLISLLEKIMAIQEDKFELSCGSPALKNYHRNAEFLFMDHDDGLQYRELWISAGGWDTWIIPTNYLMFWESWLAPLQSDPRHETYLHRLEACVVTREKPAESETNAVQS